MKTLFTFLIGAIMLNSCATKENYIPDTYVNIEINLNLPEYSELNAIGNSKNVATMTATVEPNSI